MRSNDVNDLMDCEDLLEGEYVGFDASLFEEPNVVLIDEETKNVALFEYDLGGIYTGHYFFRVGGRKGLDVAKGMIEEMFSYYHATVIKGLTPKTNKKALWFSRQLGFEAIGNIDTPLGEMVLQMIRKQ